MDSEPEPESEAVEASSSLCLYQQFPMLPVQPPVIRFNTHRHPMLIKDIRQN